MNGPKKIRQPKEKPKTRFDGNVADRYAVQYGDKKQAKWEYNKRRGTILKGLAPDTEAGGGDYLATFKHRGSVNQEVVMKTHGQMYQSNFAGASQAPDAEQMLKPSPKEYLMNIRLR